MDIREIRKKFADELKNDLGLLIAYQSNIAMFLHDRYDITGYEERNQAAIDILNLILDSDIERFEKSLPNKKKCIYVEEITEGEKGNCTDCGHCKTKIIVEHKEIKGEWKTMDLENLLKSMTNIKPDDEQIQRIEKLRIDFKKAGESLFKHCNSSREMAIAITKLEESLMWATKSIVLENIEND